jgi:hypothetical protein
VRERLRRRLDEREDVEVDKADEADKGEEVAGGEE